MANDVLDPTYAIVARYTEDVPVNVDGIARDLGLPVIFDQSLDAEIAGKIVRSDRGSPSGFEIYIRAADNRRRQRFTLAHEIGHYVLHRDLIGDGLIDSALYRSKLGEWYERQANRFAADTLMPRGIVRALFRGGMKSYVELAKMLDVSESAVKIRLEELNLG
jgi:hypothetical protein